MIKTQTTVPQNKVLLTDSNDTTTRAYANIARRTTDTTITKTTTTINEPTPTPTTTQKQSIDTSKSEFTTELPEITSTFDLDSPTDNIADLGSTEISPLDSDAPTPLPDEPLNTEPNKNAFSNKLPTFSTRSTTTTEASVAFDNQILNAIKDTTALNANNNKPNRNKNNDKNNVEVSSVPEFLASVSSPRPFGFSKRTRRPIARYTSTPVSVSADSITTNDTTSVPNKVSAFATSAINRNPADSLRPLSGQSRGKRPNNDQFSLQKVSSTSSVNDPSHDPTLSRPSSSVVQSDLSDDTESPYFVPELSQNTRNTFSVRPSRFRPTTNGEYATATQQSIPARRPYIESDVDVIDEVIEAEEKPTTKVQPRRRFRPKFEDGSDTGAFNSGFETTTKFIERPLRPGIGNDLSSLTAGDFYKNTGQQRRPPSRRVWPARTSSTTPSDIDASDISNDSSSEGKIEVSSRQPLRRKLFLTTTESNSDPTVLSKSSSKAIENGNSNSNEGTANFDSIPLKPRINAGIQRRPFLGSNIITTLSPLSSTPEADIVTIPAEDSELASNYRVYDLQPHHVDNTVLTAGDPVKITLGHKLNFGSTAINRLDEGRGKQVTTSLDQVFTDSPIIFLNSRRITVQPLTSVTPLLYPLLALNSVEGSSTLRPKPFSHMKEDHTEISNEASDLEAVSIDQPTATEINSPLVSQNSDGLLFNSTVRKLSSDLVTEVYAKTGVVSNINSTDKILPENYVTLTEPKRPFNRFRLSAAPADGSEEYLVSTLPEVSTAKVGIRRPSFRTPSYTDISPVTESLKPIIRVRIPLLRKTTSTTETSDDDSIERKPFGRRTSSTDEEIINGLPESAEVTPRPALLRPLNQRRVVTENRFGTRDRSSYLKRVTSTTEKPYSSEKEDVDLATEESISTEEAAQRQSFRERKPYIKLTSSTTEAVDVVAESWATTYEPNSEEVNSIRLFARPIVRSDVKGERKTLIQHTSSSTIRTIDDLTTTLPDSNEAVEIDDSLETIVAPLNKNVDTSEKSEEELTTSRPSTLGKGQRSSSTTEGTAELDNEVTTVMRSSDDKLELSIKEEPILRTSTSTIDSDVSEVVSVANTTAVPNNRTRKIILRRKTSAINSTNLDNGKLTDKSSSSSTVSPKRKRIRILVRKPDPSIASETDIPRDIDITTTNIELLPVRGVFSPLFTSSAEAESAEASRRSKAKGETSAPDRLTPRTRPKLPSIEASIKYDSSENENFLKGPLSNYEDNIEDNGSNNQGEEDKNPSSTTPKSIIRPFGSRAPFQPVRPTGDTPEIINKLTSSTPRSYVRKYSTKFPLPSQPTVEENVRKPNAYRFRNNSQKEGAQNEDQKEYDENNTEEGNNDDEAEKDTDFSGPKTFVPASRNRNQETYKPKTPRLRPTLPATTPSSRRQNIPYSGKFLASSAELPTNQLLKDLDRNALNSRNKKIFEKNSKKHFTFNASTPSQQQQQQSQNPAQTNTNIDSDSSTDDYNTNTVVTNSYGGEEYSTLSLEQLLDHTIHDNINTINFNELQEATTISTASASKSASAKQTTTQKPTTLHHIFAIDIEDKTEAMPDLKESERNSELITQKLEKIAEVSRIVEISSQQQTHTLNSKTGKSTASNLVIEKLPTVDKLGEISRITLIKLVDYNEQDGRTPTPEVVAARLKEKKSRQLMSPENIFSVETSTIPLEALFDKERSAKQLKDGIVYATSLGETERSVQATSTATPIYRSSATVDDASYVRPLAPLLRPESNESSPLVISIANLDQVTLSKVPKGNDGDSRENEDDASASSAKVSTVIASADAVSDNPHPVYVRTDSTGSIPSPLALESTSTVWDNKPNKPLSKVSVL